MGVVVVSMVMVPDLRVPTLLLNTLKRGHLGNIYRAWTHEYVCIWVRECKERHGVRTNVSLCVDMRGREWTIDKVCEQYESSTHSSWMDKLVCRFVIARMQEWVYECTELA